MSKKRIVIVNPISLFPRVMASQERVINMAKTLAREHSVDIISLVRNAKEAELNARELKGVCSGYHTVLVRNTTVLKRKLYGALYYLSYLIFGHAKRYFYWGGKATCRRIIDVINKNNFDIVQIEFWYLGRMMDYLGDHVLKIMDTVDVLFEKKQLEYAHRYGRKIPFLRKRELHKYEILEKGFVRKANIVISISNQDRAKLEKISPDNRHITIPIGQDIEYFNKFTVCPDPRAILFYGSLASDQNMLACERLYYRIYPKIKARIPDVKLLIVGAQPPDRIRKMHDGVHVEVTGFIPDVRVQLARGWLAILPMELAGGFRGRVIDLMAMGIPVIGTHNALDCLEMRDGTHGYISDDDAVIASRAVALMENTNERNRISRECKIFVAEKYSLDATYGKLARLYTQL